MKKFIVAWEVKNLSDITTSDRYAAFIEMQGNLTPEMQARRFYQNLLENEIVSTANICEIIESTDYTIDRESLHDFASSLVAYYYKSFMGLKIYKGNDLLFSCQTDGSDDYWDTIIETTERPDYDLNLWDDGEEWNLTIYPIKDDGGAGVTDTSIFETVKLIVIN